EPFRIDGVEVASSVKQTDVAGALSRLDHQFQRAGIQPPFSLVHQLLDDVAGKAAQMLFAQLKLHVESAAVRHAHHVGGGKRHVGEAFAAFNSSKAQVCAQCARSGQRV